jgi:hypothetical protein
MTLAADAGRRWSGGYRTTIEMHGQPLGVPRMSATEFAEADGRLASIGRDLGVFGFTDGLSVERGA